MSLIRNPNQDEIRDKKIVTVRQKKLWDCQLQLMLEFQHFCERHNLKWFATSATLFAAIKFHGFNPRDCMISLAMLRPDYDKFRQLAREEFHYPLLFDPWYDHEYPKGRTKAGSWPVHPLTKIRDERTMMLEFPEWKDLPQGIWIDISPLDSFPPSESQKFNSEFEALQLMYEATFSPAKFKERLKKEDSFILPKDQLQKLVELPYKQRAEIFERNCGRLFNDSKYLGSFLNQKRKFERIWFEKIEWVPFENSAIPIPSEFEQILKTYYPNYPNHTIKRNIDIWSTDVSYKEYFEKVDS